MWKPFSRFHLLKPPLSGGHLHGADRQLHVAGGISALGSTCQGLSLCDLRRIYGWHWSRRDAQMPQFHTIPYNSQNLRWDLDFILLYSTLSSLYQLYPCRCNSGAGDTTAETHRAQLRKVQRRSCCNMRWTWWPQALSVARHCYRLHLPLF